MKRRVAASLALAALLSSPAVAGAQGYEAVRVRNGGTVSGVVRWRGPRPVLPPFPVNRDPGVCDPEKRGRKASPRLIIGPRGGVANTVVYLSGVFRGKPLPPRGLRHARKWIIRRCEYRPHVLVAPVGSYLAMRNDDPLIHNIRMFGAATYNLPMPERGTLFVKRLPRAGVIALRCDAGHGWMSGVIHVVAHPYYAVTDAEGRFSLTDVPPGDYVLKAWHEGWTVRGVIQKDGKPTFYSFEAPVELSKKVTVSAGGEVKVGFSLSTGE